MKTIVRVLVAGAGSLALAVAGASVAAADSGDGNVACNRGEICFSRDWGNYRYQKHFWYAGADAGYVWFDTATGVATNRAIRNDASAVANRDTLCDVRVVNDRGLLPDSTITIGNLPGSVSWKFLGSINDANDRHERVNCG
jgi:transposase